MPWEGFSGVGFQWDPTCACCSTYLPGRPICQMGDFTFNYIFRKVINSSIKAKRTARHLFITPSVMSPLTWSPAYCRARSGEPRLLLTAFCPASAHWNLAHIPAVATCIWCHDFQMWCLLLLSPNEKFTGHWKGKRETYPLTLSQNLEVEVMSLLSAWENRTLYPVLGLALTGYTIRLLTACHPLNHSRELQAYMMSLGNYHHGDQGERLLFPLATQRLWFFCTWTCGPTS